MKRQLPVNQLQPHPFNTRIYSQDRPEELRELADNIAKYGLLEPLVITKANVVLSGHRRLRAAQLLGLEEVPVRVVTPHNEIAELISFNKHRTKTVSDIAAEMSFLEKEITKDIGRGRNAAKNRGGRRTTTIEEVAKVTGQSASKLRWTKFINRYAPELLHRIGRDLSFDEAKRRAKAKKDGKRPPFSDTTSFEKSFLKLYRQHEPSLKDVMTVLRKIPSFVCDLTNTTGTEIAYLVNHLEALHSLDSKTINLVRKWDEVTSEKVRVEDFKEVQQFIPSWSEVVSWLGKAHSIDDVTIHDISGSQSPFTTTMYTALRVGLSSTIYNTGPGREGRFVVGFTNRKGFRVLGILRLHSDFAIMECRDRHIGWSPEIRATKREQVANLFDCIPVRSFGHNALGGKFLTLLATHPRVADSYAKKYKTPVVGLTITSLHGLRDSQYHGLEKWGIRSIGTTKGQQLIRPLTPLWQYWSEWLSTHFSDEYSQLVHGRDGVVVTAPLQQKLSLLYNLLGLHKAKFREEYTRGVFFVERYMNGRVYLKSSYREPDKALRVPNLENAVWFSWWKQKATQRIASLNQRKELDVQPFFLDSLTRTDIEKTLRNRGLGRFLKPLLG